jgi:hypothetical protein
MPMPSVMLYIANIQHNLLKVVPQIFLHTVQENCDEDHLKEVRQRCYKNLPMIISDDIYISKPRRVSRS